MVLSLFFKTFVLIKVYIVSALATQQTENGCNTLCFVVIGGAVGALLLISFTLFMLWFTKKLNDSRKSNLKHIGSANSISGMTSEYYHEEREGRVSYSSEQWSPKRPIYSSHIPTAVRWRPKWFI